MNAVLEDRERMGKAWLPPEGIHSLVQEYYTVSPGCPSTLTPWVCWAVHPRAHCEAFP